MLDECVSELNRRRKALREMERNSSVQSHGGLGRLNSTKRIPSWNNMARENSWGSLDEENIEANLQAGGPWGGPSLRRLRPVRVTHDGSDSDDNVELNQLSWTHAGGPLMRTASAAKFVQCYHDVEAESISALTAAIMPQEPKGHESGGEEMDGTNKSSTRLHRANSGELRSGKRANKIWDKIGGAGQNPGSGGNDGRSEENGSSSPDEREFVFSQMHPGMHKSASALLEHLSLYEGGETAQERLKQSLRRNSTPLEKITVSERLGVEDGGIRAQSSHPDALEAARSKEATEGLGNEDISMGEALKATSPQNQFADSQGRALERGAFGSFVHHS